MLGFERMRALFLQIAGAAAAAGCAERTIGDSDTGDVSGGGTGTTTGIVTTGGDTQTTTASGGSSATTTIPGELCEPDPSMDEGILCVAKGANACGPCDEACYLSAEAYDFAQGLDIGCCYLDAITTLCGPVEQNGACCYTIRVDGCGCDGRPLVVDGRAQVAAPALRHDWQASLSWTPPELPAAVRADAAARWTRAALDEHASIAAFARFALQLLALGAPPDLLIEAQAALADEVEHARLCFAIAAALQGRPLGPGPLPAALGELSTSLITFAVDTFREGCIGESMAAAIAGLAAARCSDPVLRAILERIAEDELRHAALAWRAVRWALGQPDADMVRAALADVRMPELLATGDIDQLPALGRLSHREDAALVVALWREVIAPCRAALLAAPAPCGHAVVGSHGRAA